MDRSFCFILQKRKMNVFKYNQLIFVTILFTNYNERLKIDI